MLEKDIENLIADHPDDFFPNEGFKLISQQYSVEGKRIDILFEDRINRKIVVEVKRGILSREASGQIAEYYGYLKSQQQDTFYELILCANIIPKERKMFLEHIGIECKELGIGLISEIAKRYQYTFLDETPIAPPIPTRDLFQVSKKDDEPEDINIWIFQANPHRYDILNALEDEDIGNKKHWLVNQHRNKIRQGHLGLIWMSGNDAGIYAIARIDSDPKPMTQYDAEQKFWTDSTEKNVEAIRVELSILKRLTNCPILRKEMLKTPGLENLSILKQCQGTNFPVRNHEWQIITEMITK